MTSRGMELLNRRTRIAALARKGLLYREIGAIELLDQRTVSRVARQAGIHRQEEILERLRAARERTADTASTPVPSQSPDPLEVLQVKPEKEL